MNDPEQTEAAQALAIKSPLQPSEPARELFPWPPENATSALSAFLETIEQSLRTPSAFFRALPQTGYASALSYFVPVGIIAAGLRLFWLNLFDLLGYHPFGIAWDWPLDRLIDFLLSPLVLVGALFVVAVVLHGSLKLLGGTHAPFVTTARVIAFSSAPQLFEFFPLVGSLAALLGTVALVVIGLREAHRTTTGRALAAFALPVVTIVVLALVLLLIVILGDIAAVLGQLSI